MMDLGAPTKAFKHASSLFSALALLSVLVEGGQKKSLEAKVGDKILLQASTDDLRGEYLVVWSAKIGKTKETLFVCDSGHIDRHPPKRLEGKFSLNTRNGSLTIGPLSESDSCEYEGDVIDGDNKRHQYIYELTVSEAQTTTSSHNSTHSRRLSLGLVIAALMVLWCWFFTT